jgi:hypothetical protein
MVNWRVFLAIFFKQIFYVFQIWIHSFQGYNKGCCEQEKRKINFLVYKEIQSGAVAKLYMRKGFLIIIYEETRKYLIIYEEAVSHI